ncbi:MAG: hypothetical protein PHT07_17585 [Paludibacter sp.]|nr:hypothetical protein [Paludibacter sp.]
MGNSINFDGIIIPDNSPLFLAMIGIHVLAALICILSALLAIFTRKTDKRHPVYGKIYFWSLLVVFATSIVVSIIRWPLDNHLLGLGMLSFSFAFTGRMAQRYNWKYRMRWHLICMSLSFILLLTAFYVDNGKNLPLWKLLPEIYYWIIPGIIGIPVMLYVLLNHPLTRFRDIPPTK